MLNVRLKGTIEIDEAVITGRRKYHCGRAMTRLHWIFGLYSREDKCGYAFIVPDRTITTLFPILQRFFLN